MELPACPVCGDELRLESPEGPARCGSCGFLTTVEVDGEALSRLLVDASSRGLGPRPSLAPGRHAPEPRLQGRTTPSMLENPGPPAPPRLSPPPVPEGLEARAPPPLPDIRAPLKEEDEKAPATQMEGSIDRDRGDRRRDLGPRGELMR